MAQTTTLTDDFDPSIKEGVQTFTYAWQGKAFEVDLGPENADEYSKIFNELIEVSRQVGSSQSSGRPRRTRGSKESSGSSNEASAIREWAQANGITVSARGRISDEVKQRYHAAVGTPAVEE
jgi:hypothetical protein